MNVIITGASQGIGFAVAAAFATDGHRLLLCSRNAKKLYDAVSELQQRFPQAEIKAQPADMSVKEEILAFANWCLSYGTPDILVNNAGRFLPGNVSEEEEGVLEDMIQTNLYSAYHLTRQLIKPMMAAGSGHIFNICSIAALQAYTNGGSYSISKFALNGFTKNLREEMKPHGIKVTAVHPGATMSGSWDGFDIDPKRIMEAADVAKMIHAAAGLSPMAVMEEIILRPQLGDL